MKDKGAKKNKAKSQKQTSEELRKEENDTSLKQSEGKPEGELFAEETAKKKQIVEALDANMRAVKKKTRVMTRTDR